MKRQQIVHSYGEEEEELEDSDDFQAELEKRIRDDSVGVGVVPDTPSKLCP